MMAFVIFPCLIFIPQCKAFSGYTVSSPYHFSLPSNTSATGIAKLPAAYSKAGYPQNPTMIEQIRNTLALYPLAVDGKAFGALDLVFTQDVVANYSAPLNVLSPLSILKSEVEGSLAYVTTQQELSTQVIEVMPSACEAKSLTYVEATLFGQGHYEDQICMLVNGGKTRYHFLKSRRANNVVSRSFLFMLSQYTPDPFNFPSATRELNEISKQKALQTMLCSISCVI